MSQQGESIPQIDTGKSLPHRTLRTWRFSLQEMLWASACFIVAFSCVLPLFGIEKDATAQPRLMTFCFCITMGIALLTKHVWLALGLGTMSTVALIFFGR